jgi:AcrR family transcriptional regulator
MSLALETPDIKRDQTDRSKQADRTRARILEAAIDSLFRFGYSATSTIRIAETANVSRGAMLHHFPTKAIMMAAVLQAKFEQDLSFYNQALSSVISPLDRLDALMDAAWIRFKSPSGIAQTEIWQASRSDPELAEATLSVREQNVSFANDGVFQMISVFGSITKAQSDSLSLFVVSALRGLAMEKALGAPESTLLPSIARLKKSVRDTVEEIAQARKRR